MLFQMSGVGDKLIAFSNAAIPLSVCLVAMYACPNQISNSGFLGWMSTAFSSSGTASVNFFWPT